MTGSGARSLPEPNRLLGLNLPLDGPKTLNGLLLEQLEDIPKSEASIKLGDIAVEVLQTEDRRIKQQDCSSRNNEAGQGSPPIQPQR
jgi:Mg2+/Co2+ transporter CorB